MFRKIFFVSLQYVNFIGFTIWLIYTVFKWLPKKLSDALTLKNVEGVSEKVRIVIEQNRREKYSEAFACVLLQPFVFVGVSALSAWLDRLGGWEYMILLICAVMFVGFIMLLLLMWHISTLCKRFNFDPPKSTLAIPSIDFITSCYFSGSYAFVLFQTVYVTICLFM